MFLLAPFVVGPAFASCPGYAVQGTSAHGGRVPADADLWVFYDLPEPPDVELTRDGVQVQASLIPEGRQMARVQLQEPLQVGATYLLFGDTFVVEPAGNDTTPPTAPTIERIRKHFRADRDYPTEGMTVQAQLDGDAAWLEVEVATSATFDDAVRFGAADDYIGVGALGCGTSWPDYRRGRSYAVRARQVDAAGNVSAWTDTQRTCGCAASAWSLADWSSLVGGLLRR